MRQIKFVSILILLSSCIEVEFKHPMPPKGTTLEKIPEDVITYFISLEEVSTSETDKVSITDLSDDFDWNEPLPEGVILKEWKGNYFLNQKEDSVWQILMVKPGPNKTYEVYQLDGSNKATVDKLKEITDVEEVFLESGDLDKIIIDPTFKEFKLILKSGAFERMELSKD